MHACVHAEMEEDDDDNNDNSAGGGYASNAAASSAASNGSSAFGFNWGRSNERAYASTAEREPAGSTVERFGIRMSLSEPAEPASDPRASRPSRLEGWASSWRSMVGNNNSDGAGSYGGSGFGGSSSSPSLSNWRTAFS